MTKVVSIVIIISSVMLAENKCRLGDEVRIEESRPYSKKKRFVVTNIEFWNQDIRDRYPNRPNLSKEKSESKKATQNLSA